MVAQWTAEDVHVWLCSHGVSDAVARRLRHCGVGGPQLMRLYWAAVHGRQAVWAALCPSLSVAGAEDNSDVSFKTAAPSVQAACGVLEEDGWMA